MSEGIPTNPAPGDRGRERPAGQDPEGLVESAPGLARLAASAWLRTIEWTVGSAARAGGRIVEGTLGGDAPPPRDEGEARDGREREPLSGPAELRRRGEELLRRSAEVGPEDEAHPAYMRILEELAPDEARILRLLATEGPKASIDVRGGLPMASELVALGLTMVAEEAGCRAPDRVHAYLNNLHRLGLIWFSREPLRDPLDYQVLEAQPEVGEAMKEAGRLARTVRRSIQLTPFGADFCRVCLPLQSPEAGLSSAP
jgi:hypothetical protein